MCDICIKQYVVNDLDSILKMTANISGTSIDALRSKIKIRKLADARKAYFIMAKYITGASLEQIGGKVNRDHVTVLYGLNNHHIPEIQRIVRNVRDFYFVVSGISKEKFSESRISSANTENEIKLFKAIDSL